MSDSRLEKFIYTICSMDVSDLPAPLSRIEKLWNCLITGETPDFEPISRNEKYLMAMLGLYELENLPTPMSRGEKLLYKIAVGETDLSDVPGYLSRYEELLKYLIENGGISGGDFEYVLYTINQSLYTLYATAEKPVKSAILKGQTLVNLASKKTTTLVPSSNDIISNDLIKSKTTYTIAINVYTLNERSKIRIRNVLHDGSNSSSILDVNIILGKNIFTVTTVDNAKNLTLNYHNSFGTSEVVIDDIVIIEDNHANIDIPYFTGMQSVKMPVLTATGKNLLDPSSVELVVENDNSAQTVTYDSVADTYEFLCPNSFNQMSIVLKNLYKITSANQVYVSGTYESDGETREIGRRVSVNEDKVSMGIVHNWKPVTKANLKIMITSDNSATTTAYEPFKSNILTVNEDVELRGIGDVRDTLDLLTGEVTERIGEVVLDGSEDWSAYITNEDTISFIGSNIADAINKQYDSTSLMADKLIASGYGAWTKANNVTLNTKKISICVLKSVLEKVDVNGFKKWLSENPIKVQYVKADEPIKTVDLTTVDQDGQPTKLKTFNDISHIEINADNIIPSVDVEVATKISETLSTMGPQQLDISNTQNELSQTIDEQTENTDATMMATTEIYEQIL